MDELANIYLLVGFFGSGKTTLIRKLLANTAGRKYAIIQNEFAEGEMGIEQPLIVDETGTPFSSFLELPNGCICCSAKYLPPHSGTTWLRPSSTSSPTRPCAAWWWRPTAWPTPPSPSNSSGSTSR
jgi:GTPase SAR1 family protein